MTDETTEHYIPPSTAELYEIKDLHNTSHNFLHLPSLMNSKNIDNIENDCNKAFEGTMVRNIIIVDTSCSIRKYRKDLCKLWNKYIVPNMKGNSILYTFNEHIKLMRNSPILENSDFSILQLKKEEKEEEESDSDDECSGGYNNNWVDVILDIVNKEYILTKKRFINIYLIVGSKRFGMKRDFFSSTNMKSNYNNNNNDNNNNNNNNAFGDGSSSSSCNSSSRRDGCSNIINSNNSNIATATTTKTTTFSSSTFCGWSSAMRYWFSRRSSIFNTYILGIGTEFSIIPCLKLQYYLYRGPENKPAIFWAKSKWELKDQICKLVSYVTADLESFEPIELVDEQHKLPLFRLNTPSKSPFFYRDEWLYLPHSNNVDEIKIPIRTFGGETTLKLIRKPTTPNIINDLVRQWLFSMMKEVILDNNDIDYSENFVLINSIYKYYFVSTTSLIDLALERDQIADLTKIVKIFSKRNNYYYFYKSTTTIILNDLYDKFNNNGFELLKKLLGIDIIRSNKLKEFKKACEDSQISEIDYEKYEDVCAILHISTLTSLQNIDEIVNSKCMETAMKLFTMSGIPICTYLGKDMLTKPWSYKVKSVLTYPYNTLSLTAIESCKNKQKHLGKKMVALDQNRKSVCNCIIPVFPAPIANNLRTIINTSFYSECCIYSLTRSIPKSISYVFHLAALAALWMFYISQNYNDARSSKNNNNNNGKLSEYIKKTINDIIATAKLYVEEQEQCKQYIKVLYGDIPYFHSTTISSRDNVMRALQPSYSIFVEGEKNTINIRCDSLIKPMFFYSICDTMPKYNNDNNNSSNNDNLSPRTFVGLLLIEFVRRYLNEYCFIKKNSKCDIFTYEFEIPKPNLGLKRENKKRKLDRVTFDKIRLSKYETMKWLFSTTMNHVIYSNDSDDSYKSLTLLKKYYTLEECEKETSSLAKKKLLDVIQTLNITKPSLSKTAKIMLNFIDKNITFNDLKAYAKYIGVDDDIFCDNNLLLAFFHSFEYPRGTKDHFYKRKKTAVVNLDDDVNYYNCESALQQKLLKMETKELRQNVLKKVISTIKNKWLAEYYYIHCTITLIPSLSKSDVIKIARKRKVVPRVDEKNFDQIYRNFRYDRGILSNACQYVNCPHFIQPYKQYSQHAVLIRRTKRNNNKFMY